MKSWKLLVGNAVDVLKDVDGKSIQMCVTSPPYFGLRDYGHSAQIGLESTMSDYVARLVEVFAEVHRVLKDDGTLWLNLGDSYTAGFRKTNGSKGSTLTGSREWFCGTKMDKELKIETGTKLKTFRYSVACGFCVAGCWVDFETRHNLGETQFDAGKRNGPMLESA